MPDLSELLPILLKLKEAESERESVGHGELRLPPSEHAYLLPKRHEALKVDHSFQPGQLVKWKEGLRNRKLPQYGQPAIVVELLTSPILDEEKKGAGSPYFREPLDIVLGVIDPDGDFITFFFDKRRFEPFE